MEIRKTGKFLIVFAIVSFGARILPHPANFAPITALAVFSGARIEKFWGGVLPLAIMLTSDFFIGFYDFRLMVVVYGGFFLAWLFGFLARGAFSPFRVFGASFLGSVSFYLTTNFAVWAFSSWYPKTPGGLLLSYALALPFFRNSIAGDIFFTGVFFGIYELARGGILRWLTQKTGGFFGRSGDFLARRGSSIIKL